MTLSYDRNDGFLVAEAEGRLDGSNAGEFQANLDGAIDDGDKAVVLDFTQVTYISSAGLRVVLMIAKKLERQNAKFAICGLSAPMREIFQISGFDRIIDIHEALDDAKGALTS